DGVQAMCERARRQKLPFLRNPLNTGMHSKYFEPLIEQISRSISHAHIRPSPVPVWSATTCAPYPNDLEGVRELCLRHLTHRVRFRELIETLYDSGVRAFVVVGEPGIGAFVKKTLYDRPHVVVATNSPGSGRPDLLA